ncbi:MULTISPECIES: hypothetical protein [unclassified Bradyrhizobium]|uniref:hypothetical protein n=1 Tax=unclassified Bradyrhizobium TaxID=2631580 RepID=UPI002916B9BF|nr:MULTISPECIES: hypothetical protein [unclassified Bradyrhizobium]
MDQPIYDPSTIDCPVLVLATEWDVDVRFGMAHDLFVRLVSAPSSARSRSDMART